MNTQSLKLQTYLAHAGIASRRKAEKLIEEGLVMVNGQVAQIGQRVIPGQDQIKYRGKVITLNTENTYVLIDKPVGVVSTTEDDLQRRDVLSLLPAALQAQRLYPVGRLDQDSQGLMLLTNDGEVAYRLTHPKFEVPKTYVVKVDRVLTSKAFQHLQKGVRLSEGPTQTLKLQPCRDESIIDEDIHHWYEITIAEGRNHQVKRMFERVGYLVKILIRTEMGPLNLNQLPNQEYYILTPEEITSLKTYLHLK